MRRCPPEKMTKNEKSEPVTDLGYDGFEAGDRASKDALAARLWVFCAVHKNALDQPIGFPYIRFALRCSKDYAAQRSRDRMQPQPAVRRPRSPTYAEKPGESI
jgi:hypothetical protein